MMVVFPLISTLLRGTEEGCDRVVVMPTNSEVMILGEIPHPGHASFLSEVKTLGRIHRGETHGTS